MKILTRSPSQTQKIAKLLVKAILANPSLSPRIFCLQGNLGSGKTTFIQGVAKALKIKNKILSPTFILMKSFPLNKKSDFENFYHFDFYRLEDPAETKILNFQEILANPKNLIFIEWPEKVKDILPSSALWIEFKIKEKNQREIEINY